MHRIPVHPIDTVVSNYAVKLDIVSTSGYVREMKLILSLAFLWCAMVNELVARPTVNASGLKTESSCTSIKVKWTKGNGSSRILVMRKSDTVDFVPVDGMLYQGGPPSGAGLGNSGQSYIVYTGNADSVSVTGLETDKVYYFKIYEMDINGSEYLVNGAAKVDASTLYIRYAFTFDPIDSCENSANFKLKWSVVSNIKSLVPQFMVDQRTFHLVASDTNIAFPKSIGVLNAYLTTAVQYNGCAASLKKAIRVIPRKTAPIDFKLSSDTVQAFDGHLFQFKTVSKLAPFPMGVLYQWDFGDGTGSYFIQGKKVYKKGGRYTINYYNESTTYNKPTGCRDTTQFTVFLGKNYFEDLMIAPVWQIEDSNRVHAMFADTFVHSAVWYWGDGDSSSGLSVSHTYKDTGKYTLHVRFLCNDGKSRDSSQEVVIIPKKLSGLSSSWFASLRMHPNPSCDRVSVSGYPDNTRLIELVNLNGVTLLSQTVSEGHYTLNVSEYPAGVYWLRLKLDNGITEIRPLTIVH